MATTKFHSNMQRLMYTLSKTRSWYQNRRKYKVVYNENMLESFL